MPKIKEPEQFHVGDLVRKYNKIINLTRDFLIMDYTEIPTYYIVLELDDGTTTTVELNTNLKKFLITRLA